MKTYHKILILIASFILIVASVSFLTKKSPVGAPPAKKTDIPTLMEKYKTDQYLQITEDGRVFYKDTEITQDDLKSLIPPDTYILPYTSLDGVGYSIFEYRTIEIPVDSPTTTTRMVKEQRVTAVGPEADSRTHDWTRI